MMRPNWRLLTTFCLGWILPAHAGMAAKVANDAKGTACENYGLAEMEASNAARSGKGGSTAGHWVSAGDYPIRALNKEHEGRVVFKVLVNPDGRVGGCWVLTSSGDEDLDAAACKAVTTRARFSPALDENGAPTEGCYGNFVTYKIQKD